MTANVNPATTDTDNPAQEIQDYINQMDAQYQVAEQYIIAMQQDETAINNDGKEIASLVNKEVTYQWHAHGHGIVTRSTTVHESVVQEVSQLKADEAAKQSDVNTQQSALEALDPSFKNMDNTINALNNTINTLIANGNTPSSLIDGDVATVQKYLSQLFQAMNDKLNADMNEAIIQGAVANNVSDSQLQQCAEQMIQDQTAEQGVLSQLVNTMTSDSATYNQTFNTAKVDSNKYIAFSAYFLTPQQQLDQQTMNNATTMMNAITNAIRSLSPEMASLMPEFTEISIILDGIIKKVEALLADPAAFTKATAVQLLALMMFALGIFQMVGQQVQSNKAQNQMLMSQANLKTSEMNLTDAVANQQIQQEEMANANFMKTFGWWAQLILGAIMTLAAPGLGAAILMLTVTILQATGCLDDLVQDIAKAIGSQVGAEVIVGALELIVTCGGGALLDRLTSAVTSALTQSAVKAAEEFAEEAVEAAAAKAATAVGKAGDEVATAAAKSAIQRTVQKAAQTAVQKTIETFMKQPILNLIEMISKRTFIKALTEAVEKAAQSAAETAVAQSDMIAQYAAKGASNLENMMDQVATYSANKAVASVTNIAEKDAAQLGRSAARKLVPRAFFTALYNFSSSDYLTQIITAKMNKNDPSTQTVLSVMQVIQSLMQMVALVLGTGMMSAPSPGSSGAFLRVANLLAVATQSVSVGTNCGTYVVDKAQAGTVTAIMENDAMADLLHSFLEQMQQDATNDQNNFITQQGAEAQRLQAMASHLQDGDIAGIQILISAAS